MTQLCRRLHKACRVGNPEISNSLSVHHRYENTEQFIFYAENYHHLYRK